MVIIGFLLVVAIIAGSDTYLSLELNLTPLAHVFRPGHFKNGNYFVAKRDLFKKQDIILLSQWGGLHYDFIRVIHAFPE